MILKFKEEIVLWNPNMLNDLITTYDKKFENNECHFNLVHLDAANLNVIRIFCIRICTHKATCPD